MAAREVACAQKGALKKSQTILFADESGFYPLPGVTRTYAPRGETPVLRELATRDHLSAISAITENGQLFFNVKEDSLKSPDVVRFLGHLLRFVPGRLLVIWDNSPIHRGQAVKDFLAAGAAKRIQLERLPGYAPDLNPDEGIWSQLKQVEMKNLCCDDLDHLDTELRKAVKRLREKPKIVGSCFAGAGL